MFLKKQEMFLLLDLALVTLGLTFTFIFSNLLTLLIGLALTILGCIDLCYSQFKPKRNILKDKKGIAWIWAVAICALVFMPFVYWAISMPYDAIMTYVDANYTFTGIMGDALLFGRVIVSYLLSFCLFSIVIWSIVNAKAERYGA